ncbi:MAG: aldehyde dehydrogenase family protein, partial [Actinomycetes bacterium]
MSLTTAPTTSSAATARSVLDAAFPAGLGAFVDGRVATGSGDSITLTSAATGEPFATYADPGVEGANAILESATAGAKVWGALNGFERAAILRNVSRAVEQH